MKLSIITPISKQGKFVSDCIESVLSQKGVELELIVTNAGAIGRRNKIIHSCVMALT